jgi:hypothetical protein
MKRVLVVWAVGFLLIAFSVGSAWADDKRILDVLLKKGIISKQEYDQILQEAKEPFQGPVVAETYKDDTPTVATEEATPGGKRPPVGSYADLETKRGGIENLRKNDYRNVWTNVDTLLKHSERLSIGLVALKVQYNVDNTNRSPGTTTDPTGFAAAPVPTRDENGFRIRAAEIYVTGRLTPWSTYYMEVDFARQGEIALNSMYMDFYSKDMPALKNLYPYISQLRVGQFREPFGIEQGTSQGLLDFIDRAYYTDLAVGQNGSSVDVRSGDPGLDPFGKTNSSGFVQQLDMGVEVTSKAPQLPWAPELKAAVVNGAGRNFNDNNADKDVTGRLSFTPTAGMKVYLSSYFGTAFYNGAATATLRTNTDVKKFRDGAMYTYIPPFFNNLVKLQGEYIEGYDNGFRRRTWYQYVLFRPLPFLPNFEPAYRYEQFTMDTNRANSTLDRHTVGFNYYFDTNVKFTLNYEIKHDGNEGNPFVTTGGGVANPNNKNFLTTQIQFRY